MLCDSHLFSIMITTILIKTLSGGNGSFTHTHTVPFEDVSIGKILYSLTQTLELTNTYNPTSTYTNFRMTRYTCNGVNLENVPLTNKISSLLRSPSGDRSVSSLLRSPSGVRSVSSLIKDKNDTLTLYGVFKLGCAPASVGNLRLYKSQLFVKCIELFKDDSEEVKRAILHNKYMASIEMLNELDKVYKSSNGVASINVEDPITLEDLHEMPNLRTMIWMENGKKYKIKYDSLVKYMSESGIKLDSDGQQQIINPYTNKSIPEPYRTDFLFINTIHQRVY